MTEEGIGVRPPQGVPGIDPRGWIEPKETFPGVVITSEYRQCDPKYMEPNQFRTVALPRAVWQWDLRVERLDAVYQLPDGSQAAVVRYGGYDLERWNNRTGEIEAVNLRSNKEQQIGNAWVSLFSTVEPPESLLGKKAMFEFYPSKRVSKNNVAKNILLPISALPPDWTFTGEKQVFVVSREATEAGATADAARDGASAAPIPQPAAVLSEDDAFARLPALLNGLNRTDVAGIINKLPAEMRHGSILNGIISGDVFTRLQTDGAIEVASNGAIIAK